MRAFFAIVKLTCKSVIRSHIFQILMLLLTCIIIALPLTLVGDGTAEAQIQISLQYCLGAVSFILSLSIICLSCFTMSSDVESYQMHMVVTKPIARAVIWLGKASGILLIHTILLLISALFVYLLVLCQFQDRMFLKYAELPLWIIMGVSGVVLFVIFAMLCRGFFIRLLKMSPSSDEIESMAKHTRMIKIGAVAFAVLIITGLVFLGMRWQFNRNAFSLMEKAKIRSKVLVGRRVYMPVLPEVSERVKEEYERTVRGMPENMRHLSSEQQAKLRRDIQKRVLSRIGEVKFRGAVFWKYSGLPPSLSLPLFLRYRAYVGKIASGKQRESMGMWGARFFIPDNIAGSGKDGEHIEKAVFGSLSEYPDKIMGGVFIERVMPPSIISKKGEVLLGFTNLDPQKKTLFFQVKDGPKLLVKVAGFVENYCRAILVVFLKLLVLTGLSCAVGGVFSASVAIFSIISYLLAGFFSTFLIGVDNKLIDMGGSIYDGSIIEQIGSLLSRILILFIIPMQSFEVSGLLSGGELIEWSMIGNLLLYDVILKGVPLFILGIWLYSRRELGLVIRK